MILSKIRAGLRPIRRALQLNPDRFLKKVHGVIHVGANHGQERELYEIHNLNVLWIEPIPEVFDQLKINIANHPKQRALQALITDVDDKDYDFHIANNGGASSSLLDLKLHKDLWPGVEYTATTTLKSCTLTTLLKREQIEINAYSALIMDTQGSELMILKGALSLLDHFEYIQVEVPDFESYESCCQQPEMSTFMTEHGYREWSRSKFASRAEGGSYFDIIYKKRR